MNYVQQDLQVYLLDAIEWWCTKQSYILYLIWVKSSNRWYQAICFSVYQVYHNGRDSMLFPLRVLSKFRSVTHKCQIEQGAHEGFLRAPDKIMRWGGGFGGKRKQILTAVFLGSHRRGFLCGAVKIQRCPFRNIGCLKTNFNAAN